MPVHPYLGNIKAAIGRAARLLEQFVDLYIYIERETKIDKERDRQINREIVRDKKGERMVFTFM